MNTNDRHDEETSSLPEKKSVSGMAIAPPMQIQDSRCLFYVGTGTSWLIMDKNWVPPDPIGFIPFSSAFGVTNTVDSIVVQSIAQSPEYMVEDDFMNQAVEYSTEQHISVMSLQFALSISLSCER